MTKHFCDICNKELDENELESLYGVYVELKYGVRTNDNNMSFSEVCSECVCKVFEFIGELKSE